MPDPFLRVELKNERPVELLDLAAGLMALGQAYDDFASTHGVDVLPGNVKLYIRELRTGSIIADLQAMLDQASFVIEHREVLAAFLSNFNDVVNFFLLDRPRIERDGPSKRASERVSQIFEPVAKDDSSQLILQVHGDLHIGDKYQYNSPQANIVQNRIQRYLGPALPNQMTFHSEPLYLRQVRDDPRGRAGDQGVIEKFSEKPVKLQFMSEEAKRAVLEIPEHPFQMVFVVDGEVGLVGGRPALYKIYYVRDIFPRPEA